ncbi:MAG: GlsB/YeaQ/YmgE family stress response membrane protein [Candidatus Daviesbacteria bacterium]|nr:MAG: GlsB/YeaQ/YmgE family stress response membrane protein [Candidatus Daviesbacteria bacterium]
MSIIAWVLFGLVAGVITNLIDPAPSRGGLLGAIVLGIVGALVGGFLASLVFRVGIAGFDTSSLIVAVLGSLLVLWVSRSLRRV